MNKILKKASTLFSLFLFLGLSAYSDDLFMPLIDKADKAKVEFQDLYKYIMDQGGLSQNPNEKFDLDSDIIGHILDNGPVMLSLIDWLDKNKKDDATGLLLLRKLNRYLYLEFRHFVGQLKVNKKYEGKLVGLLHDFYKFKVPAKVGTAEEGLKYSYPFQAALSKAMIFILIVNGSYIDYDEKVENVAYYLDKIRRELIAIKNCHESCDLRTVDVNDFIELLQTYATMEPILGPNYMKRILITVAVITVIALIAWLIYKKVVPNWKTDILPYLSKKGSDLYDAIIDPLADKFADKMSKKMYDMNKINEALGLVRGQANTLWGQALNQVYDSRAEVGLRRIVQARVVVPEPPIVSTPVVVATPPVVIAPVPATMPAPDSNVHVDAPAPVVNAAGAPQGGKSAAGWFGFGWAKGWFGGGSTSSDGSSSSDDNKVVPPDGNN